METDDDDNSFSIHDLDNAPEPEVVKMGGGGGGNSVSWLNSGTTLAMGAGGGDYPPVSPRSMMMSTNTLATQKVKNSGHGNKRRHSLGQRNQLNQTDSSVSATASAPTPNNSGLNSIQKPNVLGLRDRTWSAPPVPNFYPTPPSQGQFLYPDASASPQRRTYSYPENNSNNAGDQLSSTSSSSFLRRQKSSRGSSMLYSSSSYEEPSSGNASASAARSMLLRKSRSERSLMATTTPPTRDSSLAASSSSLFFRPSVQQQRSSHTSAQTNSRNERTYLQLPEFNDNIHNDPTVPPPDEPSSELSIFESNDPANSTTPLASNTRHRLGSGESSTARSQRVGNDDTLDHSRSGHDDDRDNSNSSSSSEDDLHDEEDNQSDGTNEDGGRGVGAGKKHLVHLPTLHKVSSLVAMYAPCFWLWYCCSCFMGGKATVASRLRQPTDRAILARLNILIGLFTLFQIGSAIFFIIITLAPNLVDRVVETRTPSEESAQEDRLKGVGNVWNVALNVILLGIIAVVALTAALLTIKVVRTVNLVGAIRYLWALLWILPFEFYFNIGLYDYFRVTEVWVRQYWRDPSLGWFRNKFCKPSSTANTLCAVPLGVNETDWCLDNYNSTVCSSTRDGAQSDSESWLLGYYYINAAFGVVLIVLFILVVNTLESIISKPLVQKSRQSNIPAWFALPVCGCVVFGVVYSFADTSVLNARTASSGSWIGPLYLATGGLFFVASALGWYISWSSITNSRHKRNKMISIMSFLTLMGTIGGILIAVFAFSITYSSSFVEVPLTESKRGDLACTIDQAGSCTNCTLPEGDPDRCPEWTVSDVTKVIQTQAKSSATLAAIFFLYALSAFRFGLGMRQAIRMYQIDYV